MAPKYAHIKMSENLDEKKKRVDLHGNLIKEGGEYVKTGAGEAKNEVEKGLGSIGDKFKAGAKAMGFKKKEDWS